MINNHLNHYNKNKDGKAVLNVTAVSPISCCLLQRQQVIRAVLLQMLTHVTQQMSLFFLFFLLSGVVSSVMTSLKRCRCIICSFCNNFKNYDHIIHVILLHAGNFDALDIYIYCQYCIFKSPSHLRIKYISASC